MEYIQHFHHSNKKEKSIIYMCLIAKRLWSNRPPYKNWLKIKEDQRELHNALPLALEDTKNLCHKLANLLSQGIKEPDNQAEIRILQ